jgi:hypothetical protein
VPPFEPAVLRAISASMRTAPGAVNKNLTAPPSLTSALTVEKFDRLRASCCKALRRKGLEEKALTFKKSC